MIINYKNIIKLIHKLKKKVFFRPKKKNDLKLTFEAELWSKRIMEAFLNLNKKKRPTLILKISRTQILEIENRPICLYSGDIIKIQIIKGEK